jgi:DNA-binding LacI/PurR family transcriptional regulator
MLGYHYRRGYEAGLAEAGIVLDEGLIFRNPTSEAGGFLLGQQVAATEASAVMLCSEAATVGLYAGLAQAGRRPGADVSIITFRENPHLRFLDPAPAAFRIDISALGRSVGERLLALLQGPPEARAEAARAEILIAMDYLPAASVQPFG